MYYNEENYELKHFGTPRHSGRYPWGSGERPYQGDSPSYKSKRQLSKKEKEYNLKKKADSDIRRTLEVSANSSVDKAMQSYKKATDAHKVVQNIKKKYNQERRSTEDFIEDVINKNYSKVTKEDKKELIKSANESEKEFAKFRKSQNEAETFYDALDRQVAMMKKLYGKEVKGIRKYYTDPINNMDFTKLKIDNSIEDDKYDYSKMGYKKFERAIKELSKQSRQPDINRNITDYLVMNAQNEVSTYLKYDPFRKKVLWKTLKDDRIEDLKRAQIAKNTFATIIRLGATTAITLL